MGLGGSIGWARFLALPDESNTRIGNPRRSSAGSIVIAAIEGELTARPFAAIEGEDAQVWGVVAGVVRSLP